MSDRSVAFHTLALLLAAVVSGIAIGVAFAALKKAKSAEYYLLQIYPVLDNYRKELDDLHRKSP